MWKSVTLVLTSLMLLNPIAGAEEDPPKELLEAITKSEELLNKEAILDFLKHAMHPDIVKEMEKSGKTLEEIAQDFKLNTKRINQVKKVFSVLKKSKCELNADKTQATFTLSDDDLGEEKPPKNTITFALHEKKWYVNER